MFCDKCQNHFSNCVCPDIEKKLDSIDFIYRYCKKCEKHYERCRCKKPDWGIKGLKAAIKSLGGA